MCDLLSSTVDIACDQILWKSVRMVLSPGGVMHEGSTRARPDRDTLAL